MKICRLCKSSVVARGLCRRHYEVAWRSGEHLDFPVKHTPLRDRLLAKVDKQANGCWHWTGQTNYYGYGLVWRDGRAVRAHRVAFELFNGPIEAGAVICHSCDNPKCVNPKHLFKGTRLDNNRDAASKGRRPSGQRHHATRLSAKDVLAIRRSRDSQSSLAKRYGVHQSHICKIKGASRRSLV
jgi:hypothetical protein